MGGGKSSGRDLEMGTARVPTPLGQSNAPAEAEAEAGAGRCRRKTLIEKSQCRQA